MKNLIFEMKSNLLKLYGVNQNTHTHGHTYTHTLGYKIDLSCIPYKKFINLSNAIFIDALTNFTLGLFSYEKLHHLNNIAEKNISDYLDFGGLQFCCSCIKAIAIVYNNSCGA